MAVNDCFTIGAIVLCTTCFNEEVEGEVLAFDYNTKMLILKCQSKGSEKLNDIYVLNLSFCSNVQVIKESITKYIEEPQKLNLEQLNLRVRKTLQHRQTYLQSRNSEVSLEGQELYRVIAKQFNYNEVSWKGLNIQIFNEVTVTPPYRVENIISSSNNKSLCNYIKKMIEQFLKTRTAPENANNFSTATLKTTTVPSLSSTSNSSSFVLAASSSNTTTPSPVSAS